MYRYLSDLPVLRAYAHNSVPYYVGSVWGNMLGLQVFRTISQNLQCRLRSQFFSGDVGGCSKTVERDGVVSIENFLQPEQFEKVRAEFEASFDGVCLRPYKENGDAKLYRTQIGLTNEPKCDSTILEYFQRNEKLNAVAARVIGRRISRLPSVHLDWYENNDPTAPDNDIENILHADLHSPTVKMFFYLEDVDRTNGAFVYAKGSHRFTFRRLRHEYEFSIRQARLRKQLPVNSSLLEHRGRETRNIIHPVYRQKMNVRETHMCVKANTLVIANNMGFHRRGEFLCDRPRKSIQINYRHLEHSFGKGLLSLIGK